MPTIGTCSICQGPVQLPELWSGDVPPVAKCGECGASAKNPYGPVIPMTAPDLAPRKWGSLAQAPRGGWKP